MFVCFDVRQVNKGKFNCKVTNAEGWKQSISSKPKTTQRTKRTGSVRWVEQWMKNDCMQRKIESRNQTKNTTRCEQTENKHKQMNDTASPCPRARSFLIVVAVAEAVNGSK